MTTAVVGRALATLAILATTAQMPEPSEPAGATAHVDSDAAAYEAGLHGSGSAASSGTQDSKDRRTVALRQVTVVSCSPTIPKAERFSGCSQVATIYLGCPDGETEGLSTFERTRASATDPWSEWDLINWVMCSPDTPQAATVAVQVREEWARLQPGVPDVTIQPDQDWVYSTVPTIVYVDPTPVIVEETLLGTPVRIRATPTTFAWSWGDGEHTTTSDPGKPYPDETVSHTYLYVDGEVDVTLQTTWSGAYSVNGGTWVDIDGTLTTASDPVTLTVYSPHSALVDCDLDGRCLTE